MYFYTVSWRRVQDFCSAALSSNRCCSRKSILLILCKLAICASTATSNAQVHGQPGKQYLETVLVPLGGTRQITLDVREVR
jgi:hypothetical protein